MHCSFPQKLIVCVRRSCKAILVLFWYIGFCGGALAAAAAGNLTSLMRAYCDSSVSIVGLLIVPFFPFLLSAVAVYFSCTWLLYSTALGKMFCFGFCACAVSGTFGNAGWLICLLLLFTDFFTMPVLCWFQLRYTDTNKKKFWTDVFICVFWFAAVCIADRIWIMPLLRDIF